MSSQFFTKHSFCQFSSWHNEEVFSLKEHLYITVTRADKENVAYIPYENQCLKLSKAIKIVIELDHLECINGNRAKQLFTYNIIEFHKLPKIHKPSLSLRSIITVSSSPTIELANFVTNF